MTEQVKELYRDRFNEKERKEKGQLWQVLCKNFLQKYVPQNAVVLDLGAGYCDFINNIRARIKYAVDINEDTICFANPDVKVFNTPTSDMSFLSDNSVDIIFFSNFLEHLENKKQIVDTLVELHRICKIGGKILMIQPNIRYIYKEYWDFFDHHIPLSDKSVTEALKIARFKIDMVIPKFLPYTTKSNFPKVALFLNIYLKLPLLWHIMGKHMFIVAQKEN